VLETNHRPQARAVFIQQQAVVIVARYFATVAGLYKVFPAAPPNPQAYHSDTVLTRIISPGHCNADF
jgi:hypothetical protein